MSLWDINQEHIQSLLEQFAKKIYRAPDCEKGNTGNEIMDTCITLLKLDYSIVEISNRSGELSANYPNVILVPQFESPPPRVSSTVNGFQFPSATSSQTIYESLHDPHKLRDLITRARLARCRARFPVPVILYKGKYICRSATLSGGPEIYGRSGLDYLFYGVETAQPEPDPDTADAIEASEQSLEDCSLQEQIRQGNGSDWQLLDRVRSQDIKLLKTLNVGTIVDFMVEKKKVKFGVNVTSSEKVDKEKRYSDFTIISLPYPGCEFFRDFRDNNYSGGLVFDWTPQYVDASIGVPDDSITSQLQITWDSYKSWDLVQITQNYLKLLLKYIQENSSGILIHCISGWDRTPLFISLLRLSMWADGVIHQSLTANQILYYTIAYDWYMFGHNLPDRLNKGEEIFFFCFYALKYIIDDEFSVLSHRYKSKHSSGSSSVSVLRTDSESMLDGMLLDGESRGSSISLNSICSGISAKSQQDGNHIHSMYHDESANGNSPAIQNLSQDSNSSIGVLSNDSSNSNLANNSNWSPLPKRTSPVSVPNASVRPRQRQESSSSISVGSWQMISGTGSIDSNSSATATGSNFQQRPTNTFTNNPTNLNNMSTQDSTNTLIDDEFTTHNNDITNIRRDRLSAVRQVFYHCYCSTVGFKFKNGPDSSLGALLGNFAEKVGLSQRSST